MKSMEIWFEDLNEKAQKEVLDFYSLSRPEDGNFDISPLAIIDVEELQKEQKNEPS